MNVAEQDRERHRGRADHQLEQLKPDDLVDECGRAATDKETQHDRIISRMQPTAALR